MIHEPGFRYPNAPIAEAALMMRVDGVAPFDLERVLTGDVPGYPSRDEQLTFENTMEIGPAGVATKTEQKLSGHRFASEDGKQIALMTDATFVFSRLAPYDTWSRFADEALRVWEIYARATQPEAVTRLALRYINQIRPPAGEVDLDFYLRTRPEISRDMPQTTNGFFMSMDIPLVDHDVICRLTEASINDDGLTAIVLDIDVARDGRYAPDGLEELRSVLDVLRDAKNMVFEASITDEARRLFD